MHNFISSNCSLGGLSSLGRVVDSVTTSFNTELELKEVSTEITVKFYWKSDFVPDRMIYLTDEIKAFNQIFVKLSNLSNFVKFVKFCQICQILSNLSNFFTLKFSLSNLSNLSNFVTLNVTLSTAATVPRGAQRGVGHGRAIHPAGHRSHSEQRALDEGQLPQSGRLVGAHLSKRLTLWISSNVRLLSIFFVIQKATNTCVSFYVRCLSLARFYYVFFCVHRFRFLSLNPSHFVQNRLIFVQNTEARRVQFIVLAIFRDKGMMPFWASGRIVHDRLWALSQSSTWNEIVLVMPINDSNSGLLDQSFCQNYGKWIILNVVIRATFRRLRKLEKFAFERAVRIDWLKHWNFPKLRHTSP